MKAQILHCNIRNCAMHIMNAECTISLSYQWDGIATTTTTILRTIYRLTCVSRHLQLRTGGFCWCKVLLPHALAGCNQRIRIREKTLEFSSTVLSTQSLHLNTQTHTRLTALCPGLPGTRKVKPIWILLKQEIVSGSGISWAICKSSPCSRQITMPAPHHSVFYRPDALPAAQPTASKHWRTEQWKAVS